MLNKTTPSGLSFYNLRWDGAALRQISYKTPFGFSLIFAGPSIASAKTVFNIDKNKIAIVKIFFIDFTPIFYKMAYNVAFPNSYKLPMDGAFTKFVYAVDGKCYDEVVRLSAL